MITIHLGEPSSELILFKEGLGILLQAYIELALWFASFISSTNFETYRHIWLYWYFSPSLILSHLSWLCYRWYLVLLIQFVCVSLQ